MVFWPEHVFCQRRFSMLVSKYYFSEIGLIQPQLNYMFEEAATTFWLFWEKICTNLLIMFKTQETRLWASFSRKLKIPRKDWKTFLWLPHKYFQTTQSPAATYWPKLVNLQYCYIFDNLFLASWLFKLFKLHLFGKNVNVSKIRKLWIYQRNDNR